MSTTLQAVAGEPNRHKSPVCSTAFSIGLFFGAVVLLLVMTYSYFYIRRRIRASNSTSHPIPTPGRRRRRRGSIMSGSTASTTSSDDDSESGITSHGLEESIINSIPTLLYSELKSCNGGGSGCSICLQDYVDTDFIKLLPECKHFFHIKCVDPWLRIHPTCPICRYPPAGAPVDNHPAEEAVAMSMQ